MKTFFTTLMFGSLLTLHGRAGEGEMIPLFNGKDLSGWHADVPAADQDPKISPSFIVRDECHKLKGYFVEKSPKK